MTLKILHTADLHLGMKFTRGYVPEVQERLIEARFETFGSLVEIANKHDTDLFVIAGDLFHNTRVSRKDILRTADILKRFEGRLVLVLPGNHDYIQKGEDPLWPVFREIAAENILFLGEPKTYDLRRYDIDMTVYAAPCTSKHSSTNAIGWVHECQKDAGTKFGIGIAHGTLEGLSPDFNDDYYPMSKKELKITGIDLWLMGHTHTRYPDEEKGTDARIFFPSTPEPDGFDCEHPGYVWLIELSDDKSVRYQSICTGHCRFLTMERELHSEDDVEALKSFFHEHTSEEYLVRLKLKGRVGGEIYDERTSIVDELKESVLHLEVDMAELFRKITLEDINREFTENSFPHSLLTTLAKEQQNPLSLQMAYDLIQEVKQ
jgi:DNA repair exonuclease SbcCD nuclease subunit